ncbi:transporter substrate-binding domain-containing protein [Chitinivorax sp. PXF-14]|uniref:substrate-binding periplasmic protein n=1 Tax=Chitinivorax sp. PXF-14 TaxID=3230488 RepID=UPI003467BC56
MSRFTLSTLALTMLASAATAAELPLYLMEVPPLTINSPDRKGIVGDVVLEAMKRAGIEPRLIVEPSPRAMANVQNKDNALIIPLARLKEREDKYTWIAPVARVSRAFFSLGQRADSFDDARQQFHAIAVSRGSAGLDILLEHGFSRDQIVVVNQGLSAPRMLLAGRVDAWYNLVLESQVLFKQLGKPTAPMGAPLGSSDQYLACSKTCDERVVARLAEEIRAMQADGSARRIAARYDDD